MTTTICGEYPRLIEGRGLPHSLPLRTVRDNFLKIFVLQKFIDFVPVFRQLKCTDRGLNINGKKISNPRYADDIILISETRGELEVILRELNEAGKVAGLSMNYKKSKILKNTENPSKILLENKEQETVSETIYQGQLISTENKHAKEIVRRITLAWKKYWSLKHIFKGNFNNK